MSCVGRPLYPAVVVVFGCRRTLGNFSIIRRGCGLLLLNTQHSRTVLSPVFSPQGIDNSNMSLPSKVPGPIWEGKSIFSDSDPNLRLLCRDGTVETHCGLLGSLTELMSSLLVTDCEECLQSHISLPDFDCEEVNILLRLLYSGEVSCTRQQLVLVQSLCHVLTVKPIKLLVINQYSEEKTDRKVKQDLSTEKVRRTFVKTVTQSVEHHFENNRKSSGSDLQHCYICEVTVRDHHLLLDHLRLHDEAQGPFYCPEASCSLSASSGVHLHKHYTENHLKSKKTVLIGDPKYDCDVCSLKFNVFSKFKEHTQQIHNIRPLKCQDCNQRFNDKLGLRTHSQAKHDQRKIFQCDLCHKNFSAERLLYQHRREIHELGEKRKVECNICGFISKGNTNLKKHIKSKHTEDAKKYQCNICSKSFKSKYNLKTHERIHTGEAPYSCDGCDKKFRRASHLRQHTSRCPGKSESSLINVEILLDAEIPRDELSV